MEHSNDRKGKNPIIATQETEDKATVVEVDRISHLPEPILHRIVSFLPTKYGIRTSVLSRKWASLWSTFPQVILEEVNLRNRAISSLGPIKLLDCRRRFIRYLQQTLPQRHMENLDKLKVSTILPGTDSVYEIVNDFIDAAMRGGLKELDLKFSNDLHQITLQERGCKYCYKLPNVVFSFGSCLWFLRVVGCHILEFENLEVSFLSLKILSIENTHIEGVFLQRIISGSPALESLSLRTCHGLNAVTVSPGKVRNFVLGSSGDMKDVRIHIPTLLSFKYVGNYITNENGDVEASTVFPSTDVCTFFCLNTLTLTFISINPKMLNLVTRNLPNLRTLKIKKCCGSDRIQVSGYNLRNLVIKDCEFKEKVEVQASELHIFEYVDNEHGFYLENFQYLRTLSISGNTEITGDDLQFIVSRSPVLVTMILKSCINVEHITVLSNSLEYLEIEECYNGKEIRILTPQLLVFKYKGFAVKVSQLSASYKLTTELVLKDQGHRSTDFEVVTMREFLQYFSHYTKSMMLGCECAEICKLKDSHASSPLDYVKNFKVTTRLWQTNLVDIVQGVLSLSNCFTSLCIDFEFCSIEMEFQDLTNEELLERLRYPDIHECVKEHLTEVRARKFRGNDDEIKVVEFLLGKALQLRSMSICLEKTGRSTHTRHLEFMENVNNIPKASQNAAIVYS